MSDGAVDPILLSVFARAFKSVTVIVQYDPL